jgi:hypothetical protein
MGPGVTVVFAILVLMVSGMVAIMLRSHSVAEGFAVATPPPTVPPTVPIE